MKAQLINNENEYIKSHYYDENHARKSIPTRFPCILVLKHVEGGLGGHSVHHLVFYVPKEISNLDDYLCGFNLGLTIEE
jgi:hypothetical protein